MMVEREPEAWIRVSAAATRALSDPMSLPAATLPKPLVPRLHVWTHPALDVHTGFVVFAPVQARMAVDGVLRRISWDPREDYQRVTSPVSGWSADSQPAISIRDVPIGVDVWRQILDSLAAVQVAPFATTGTFGTDGEMCGVETFGSFGHARVAWWSAFDAALEPLVRWHGETWPLLLQF